MTSIFFFKKNKIQINKLFKTVNFKKNFLVNNVCPLGVAKTNDLTFLDSAKYKLLAQKTKASACITSNNLKKFLPKNISLIIVDNVLLELAKILKKIYPEADNDYPDLSLKKPDKKFINKF